MPKSDTPKLDDIDKKILRVLSDDGKISNKDLAEKVGLSPSPCWQRVQRLEKEGVITGYRTLLNQEMLGAPDVVFVVLTLERHSGTSPEEMIDKLALLPEILEIYLTSGSSDYLLKVAVDGTQGFEEFIRRKLHEVEGVSQSRSSFSLQCFKQIENFLPE
ncbi:Lrp/AsnC family transcriptional regulator [Ruegeria litorea]|uniref:Lrp/AsnC family transcriptional regulator n=1 Tax=Falsiruegeria litorea TaxID=1280831 RepID=A0ABS5WK45_9RHOB|nr:Lrp/AsnC family transcriptional regulator [Falsiruegeria litorea]